MGVCFPDAKDVLGLGVGMDLPWGTDAQQGFVRDPGGADQLAPHVRRFLELQTPSGASWSHVFFSIQPKDRGVPRLDRYASAWDDAVRAMPPGATRALHTTALDLGSVRPRLRGPLLELVNGLAERHGFSWVNEDVGLWSLGGKPLPYPLPPYLTDEGLEACINNVRECQRALSIPLLIEFPGFSPGVSLPIGPWDAYDYFRVLAEQTDSPVTLDVGHLLSWRWQMGHRGEDLYGDLDALPLTHCFEIHLSGCEIRSDALYDTHQGVLIEQQFRLLDRLLARCPNARAVTYEDPVIDADGRLRRKCRPSLERLAARVERWVEGRVETPPIAPATRSEPTGVEMGSTRTSTKSASQVDAILQSLVYDEGARQRFLDGEVIGAQDLRHLFGELDTRELTSLAELTASTTLERAHAGVGRLETTFDAAFRAWRELHGEGTSAQTSAKAMIRRFLAAEGRDVVEGMSEIPGPSVEECFARFCIREGLMNEAQADLTLARAITRAVAVCQEPGFTLPRGIERCAHGLRSVVWTEPPTLVALARGQVLEGAITPLIADLLRGVPTDEAAERHRVAPPVARATSEELARRGLASA